MITKYKKIIFSGVIMALALLTTSCELGEQEDYTGFATLKATSPDINITGDFDPVNGIEKDATYNFTLTLTEPQISDIKVNVYQSGGTATEGEDFVINTPHIIIPANSTTVTGSFSTIRDTDYEDTETLALTVGDDKLANTVYTPQTFNFTIENYESEDLEISFNWCVDLIFDGDTYSSGDYVDLDFFVSPAADFDINDPWATFTGDWQGGTGDCPEKITMTPADFPDGEYIIWHEIWSNQYHFLWDEKSIPVTTTFVRAGVFTETIVQDDSQAMLSTDLGGKEGGTEINSIFAKVTIANGKYTVSYFEGDEIVSGKIVDGKMRTPRPAYLNK